MAKTIFQALAIALAVSVVALAGFTVGATAGSAPGVTDETTPEVIGESSFGSTDESDTSLLRRLHMATYRWHNGGGGGHGNGHGGGGGSGHHMGELVEQLDLSPQQTERFEAIQRMFESHGGGAGGSMVELHNMFMEQIEAGRMDANAIRGMIDDRLEAFRATAYAVTDEVVALVDSLDARQREIVKEHLQNAGGHAGHGG